MTIRRDPDHEAVCASAGRHVVVVAPPGTGKTFLSVRLAVAAVPSLARHERVLLVTFSNQARAQLEREARRQKIDPESRRRIEVVNYHGFFHREVQAYRRALGLPLQTTIASTRRRRAQFRTIDEAGAKACEAHKGLIDAFAEQRFERFRDERTPSLDVVARLLAVVDAEQHAGQLVFDDLGALFWSLLERYPKLDKAYSSRYPVVIADEHQDASELQDAVVRRLAIKRLVIFADPMQLIYGFRGSKPERLQKHLTEADERFELRTPHRWHGDEVLGRWLLAVRDRLSGKATQAARPTSVNLASSRYRNAMKNHVKLGILTAFRTGVATVAVIVTTNKDARDLMGYLSRAGLYPRQLGGDEFDRAHEEMEQLPLLDDLQSLVHHAADQIATLVPTVSDAAIAAVKKRAGSGAVQLGGRTPAAEVKLILAALSGLYVHGHGHYFNAMVDALDGLGQAGHNLPRIEAVRALRATADSLSYGAVDLNEAIAKYAENLARAAQTSRQINQGLYVLTAHQAKGKEFDAVVLFDASSQAYPDSDAGRRLFYVALTRATKSWTLLYVDETRSPLLRVL